jgi:hypothetical protein
MRVPQTDILIQYHVHFDKELVARVVCHKVLDLFYRFRETHGEVEKHAVFVGTGCRPGEIPDVRGAGARPAEDDVARKAYAAEGIEPPYRGIIAN